jgi:hypothetical protein
MSRTEGTLELLEGFRYRLAIVESADYLHPMQYVRMGAYTEQGQDLLFLVGELHSDSDVANPKMEEEIAGFRMKQPGKAEQIWLTYGGQPVILDKQP